MSRFRMFLQGLKPGEIGFCIFSAGSLSAGLLLSNKFQTQRQRQVDEARRRAQPRAPHPHTHRCCPCALLPACCPLRPDGRHPRVTNARPPCRSRCRSARRGPRPRSASNRRPPCTCQHSSNFWQTSTQSLARRSCATSIIRAYSEYYFDCGEASSDSDESNSNTNDAISNSYGEETNDAMSLSPSNKRAMASNLYQQVHSIA